MLIIMHCSVLMEVCDLCTPLVSHIHLHFMATFIMHLTMQYVVGFNFFILKGVEQETLIWWQQRWGMSGVVLKLLPCTPETNTRLPSSSPTPSTALFGKITLKRQACFYLKRISGTSILYTLPWMVWGSMYLCIHFSVNSTTFPVNISCFFNV